MRKGYHCYDCNVIIFDIDYAEHDSNHTMKPVYWQYQDQLVVGEEKK